MYGLIVMNFTFPELLPQNCHPTFQNPVEFRASKYFECYNISHAEGYNASVFLMGQSLIRMGRFL